MFPFDDVIMEHPTDVQSTANTQKPIEIPCADQTLENDANTDSDEANGAVDETHYVVEWVLLSKQDGEAHEDAGCVGNQGIPGMKEASDTVVYK